MADSERRRVLLVDDSRVILTKLSMAFGATEWNVTMARSGLDAVDVVRSAEPDVVVCDLHMPDMGGFEVLERVQVIDPTLPVVILTGDADPKAILEAVHRGAFDYVVKEGDFSGVVAAAERGAAHHRLAQQNLRLTRELEERLDELEREVEERKRTEAELRDARDRATEASRAKSAFLANMSHELRTPLNAILGYADMLRDELRVERQDELVEDVQRIRDSGKHLLSIINDILDLAKIEAGSVEVYLEQVPIEVALADVVANLMPVASARGNELVLEVHPEVGERRTDLRRMTQCVMNLLSNACKFTADGRIVLRAHVASGEYDNEHTLVIDVEDTGIGMSTEQCAAVFDAFVQADASTTREYGGTGLGLAITRELVRLLGGAVGVTSELGVGSTFSIRLPTGSREPDRRGHPLHSTPHDGQRPRVLVIDDDPSTCATLERHLATLDAEVFVATTGSEGVRMAEAYAPDVICLDVVMPDLDGYQVLRALKRTPALASIPVVLVTMMDDRKLGMALGAADYLMKPVQRPELLRSMAHLGLSAGAQVLVVDDTPVQRTFLRRVVESEGWTCQDASDGAEALELMRADPPDVILLDLIMPVVDGYSVIREMAADPALQDIPVVVLTASDIPPARERFLQERVHTIIRRGGETHDTVVERVLGLVGSLMQSGTGA